MKKVLMIAAMMLMSIGAFAQGKVGVGANVGYAGYGDGYSPFGIGAKVQWEFVESFRAEAAYNYWFKKSGVGLMDIDLNLQYLIPLSEGLNVYPLVGANLAFTHGDVSKETIFGFQGGAGIEYYLAEQFKVNLDIKYQHNKKKEMKFNGPVFQLGFAYVF